ncbi:hypothetical protein [Denitratisoma oestradiolicum]|uniref:Uncharacterized protein n=1 Tax=Denitratisoma oestradiolicum TaxID=311182 RepID=A0A6S6XVQ0_9PROT|nr:hypothetical protein [Denitratisoma oestradiolicum]TWO80124.1 hypothetical protein CBW56_11165 [Denitratisoma oestradiolicum]CAB1370039.1 conserved exported protein of unknown function [Denitratisoma oestradiolicum]
MRKSNLLAASIMLLLSASVLAQNWSEETSRPVIQPQSQVTFFDSKLFDSRLSKELESGRGKVEVEVNGRIPLSNIPGRMDRWITEVAETGSVEIREAEPETRTRAIFGLLPMIFSAFQRMGEDRLYSPAKNYNATMLYKKDASGDVMISKIVFTRKNT